MEPQGINYAKMQSEEDVSDSRHATTPGAGLSKFLRIYLIATGIPATIALLAPQLIILGFLLFLVPGYILLFSPAAFFWGCIFSTIYWLTRRLVRWQIATWIALLTTALLLWAIPQPSIHAATETLAQYHLAEVTPATPIQPRGDILIDERTESWDNTNHQKLGFRAYVCDNRCLALLFEPDVRSVTMTVSNEPTFEAIRDGESSPDRHSLTYRLLPKAQCGERGLDPDMERRSGHFGHTHDDNAAMAALWGLQLTERYCLVGDPPIDRFDMLIRTGFWQSKPRGEPQPSSWSLLDRHATAQYGEIRDGAGTVLFRHFDLRTQALFAPLAIFGGVGGASLHPNYGWAVQRLPSADPITSPEPKLDTFLAVQRTVDPQTGLVAARDALRIALADDSAAGGEAASALIGNYLRSLDAAAAGPEDLALLERLLADPRIADLPRAGILPLKLSPDQLLDLLPAAIHKLATAPETAGPFSSLGEALERWPQGAFASLSRDMRDLVADPVRRRRATGLIARLSDMGAPAAPVVADIMVWHADAIVGLREKSKARSSDQSPLTLEDHMAVIDAGRRAMCRLGSLAAAQLPKMLAVEQRISLDRFERRDWDMMMVRLGRPVVELESPLSSSNEDYREFLSQQTVQEDERLCK